MLKLLAAAGLFFWTIPLLAGPVGEPIPPDTKLIKYGQDNPTTGYVRKNIRQMEQSGYDGIAIDVDARIDGKSVQVKWGGWFSAYPWKYENFQHVVDDMKATKTERFTDNFLDLTMHVIGLTYEDGTTAPLKQIDWFADDFQVTIDNMRLAARVAKDAGLKGLFMDLEQYGGGVYGPWRQAFNYAYATTVYGADAPSFEECVTQVRLRGRQIGQAITEEYPDIVLILLPDIYIVSETTKDVGKGLNPKLTGLAASQYALFPAFLDGLLEGTGPEVRIFDGIEHSYGWTVANQFEEGRKEFEHAATLAADPELFRKKVGAAFAVWIDHRGWFPEAPYYSNHYTPAEFKHAVHNALKYSDSYAWVWSEQAVTFSNIGIRKIPANVPSAYRDAIIGARKGQPVDFQRDDRGAKLDARPAPAADDPKNSDLEVFGVLAQSFSYVADLDKNWIFYADDMDVGIGYYSGVNWDTSDWKPIEIGDYFENRGYVFNGMAWYRCEFEVPANLQGKPLQIHFGGVAGGTHLYVNGRWVEPLKVYDNGVQAWDITEYVTYGEKNVLVLQNHNPAGPGGIYRSVKLATPKSE